MQRLVECLLGKTSRQLENKSPRMCLLASLYLPLKPPQGVYVLQDNSFKPLARVSGWEGRTESLKRARVVCPMTIPRQCRMLICLDSMSLCQQASSAVH